MDFSIPDRVREIAGSIRSFLDREIVPLERQLFSQGFGSVAIWAFKLTCRSVRSDSVAVSTT